MTERRSAHSEHDASLSGGGTHLEPDYFCQNFTPSKARKDNG